MYINISDMPAEYPGDAYDPPSTLTDEDRARLASVPVDCGWKRYTQGDRTVTWAEPVHHENDTVRLSLVEFGAGHRCAKIDCLSEYDHAFATEDPDTLRLLASELNVLADLLEDEQ